MAAPLQPSLDTGPSNGDSPFAADMSSSNDPITPLDTMAPDSSQITLPSTEIPQSPIDPNESFKTEVNDERNIGAVIPSSMTPPPSTQAAVTTGINGSRRKFSYSQQSNLASPPATIQNPMREPEVGSDYEVPTSSQVSNANPEELRVMLQTALSEHHKLKTEAAHYKLQVRLMSLQSEEDAMRAAVEHEMNRREVDALRVAEHTRQAKRDLSMSSDVFEKKYLDTKGWFDAAMEENETLTLRLKAAKKVIHQKEDELAVCQEDNAMLLNRIRENREHFRMFCSPGGLYHGATTPKPPAVSTPQNRANPRQAPRSAQREEREGSQLGLSALLQAMSQDHNGGSDAFGSLRPAPRHAGKHSRNAQSMSSLPTTPMHRPRGDHAALLPSVDLVPQTEPQRRYGQQPMPQTPTTKRRRRSRSRESTISADDNEELARQALQSAASLAPARSGRREEDMYDSHASQAATQMLRRDPRQSFEVADTREPTPSASARMQQKLLATGAPDKRKFSGQHEMMEGQGSPGKRPRIDERRQGLGLFQ